MWANGSMVAPGDPLVAPTHHGFTVGDGVYETLGVRGGVPFAVTRHLARLADALARTGLGAVSDESLRRGLSEVIAAGGGATTRLRITVASGVGPPGLPRGAGPLTVTIMGADGVRPPTCRAIRVPWRRNEFSPLAGVKTISAGDNAVIFAYAASKGADEAFLANTRGHLCEAISANVFIEHDGEVLTPPLASGCLPGVARSLALEWGREAGLPIRAAEVGELDYSVVDRVAGRSAAAAVSSSTRGLQQVTVFDGVDVVPGALLGQLKALWDKRAQEDLDPAPAVG